MEYTWSNDYTACTAKRVCQNDTSHDETETVSATSEVTQEATCTQAEETTYTATFNKEVFKTQTKVVTGEIDPNNHTNVEGTKAKAATCTEAGNDEYWYCSGCGKYFADEACTTEITDISKVTRPATGHDFENSTEYLHDSDYHWKKCSRCDEEDVNNKEEHKYSSVENKCDVCGYAKGTTPDTYTVSGTVYTWDNTDSNTTRVRLYDSTTSEADIKSDIQHDITDESYAKTCQYDATVLGPEKVEKTNKYTQSFSFADVKSGNYKLAAWRPAYNISSKHYAYVLRVDSIDISETLANNKIELMLYGDITNIGIIGAAGAITIARYRADDSRSLLFSDKTSEYQKKAMDLNDDGTYSPYESICIARHRANIDSPFNQHI